MLISESHLETIQFLLYPSAHLLLILWDPYSVNEGGSIMLWVCVKTNDIKKISSRISQYLSMIARDIQGPNIQRTKPTFIKTADLMKGKCMWSFHAHKSDFLLQ